jgi:hypothetical protein
MSTNLLVKCEACGKDIAQTAVTCPNCGAQNNFVHPNVKEFLALQCKHTPSFKYQHTGLRVNGSTQRHVELVDLSWKLWIAAAVLWFFLAFPYIILAYAIAMAAAACWLIGQFAGTKAQSFQVDYSSGSPVWNSTDDSYWAEVKTVLAP